MRCHAIRMRYLGDIELSCISSAGLESRAEVKGLRILVLPSLCLDIWHWQRGSRIYPVPVQWSVRENKMVSTTFAIGRTKEFDKSKEDIKVYIEHLEHWMTANKIAAPAADKPGITDSCVTMLLTVIGTKTYRVLRNLLTPHTPNTKKYAELADKLKELSNPSHW